MKFLSVFFAGVLLLAGTFTPAAHAITVVARSFDELVARADTVFRGNVTAMNSQWTGEGENRHIVTLVTFQVEETYKGEVTAVQTLRFMGGTVGGTTLEVPELPRFQVGQTAVLFVVGNGKQFCPLVGVFQGRFHVTKDGSGLERITTDDGSPVVNTTELGKFQADGTPILRRYALAGVPGMTADRFKSEIIAKTAASSPQIRSTQQVP